MDWMTEMATTIRALNLGAPLTAARSPVYGNWMTGRGNRVCGSLPENDTTKLRTHAEGCAPRRSKERPLQLRRLLHAVVGGFLGDDYVVDVGFAEAGGSDAHEFTFFGELFQGAGADVANAAFEATDELIGEAVERSFIGDTAFDTFGDGLAALG